MTPRRPIDALFVNSKQRCYVVYDRGRLWQLPRMKIDQAAWTRRQPYTGDDEALYLSRSQTIHDPILATQLRTLNLPTAVRGITLPRFEAWWERHGFEWTKAALLAGQSPLAAHERTTTTDTTVNHVTESSLPTVSNKKDTTAPQIDMSTSPLLDQHQTALSGSNDIFAEMLADLTKDMLYPSSNRH